MLTVIKILNQVFCSNKKAYLCLIVMQKIVKYFVKNIYNPQQWGFDLKKNA